MARRVGRLRPGPGARAIGPAEVRVAVHGGFVEVKDNHVIMLADMAQRPDEIDAAQAHQDESDASSRIGGASPPTDEERAAETDLKWAQARLEAAGP